LLIKKEGKKKGGGGKKRRTGPGSNFVADLRTNFLVLMKGGEGGGKGHIHSNCRVGSSHRPEPPIGLRETRGKKKKKACVPGVLYIETPFPAPDVVKRGGEKKGGKKR